MFEIDITKARVNLQSVIDDLKNSDAEIKRLNKELENFEIEKRKDEETIKKHVETIKDLIRKNQQQLKDFQMLQEDIDRLEEENTDLKRKNQWLSQEKDKFQKGYTDWYERAQTLEKNKKDLETEKTAIAQNTRLQNENNLKRISALEAEIKNLKQENQRSKNSIFASRSTPKEENTLFPMEKEAPKSRSTNAGDTVIAAFNAWAAFPRPSLPLGFDYLEGEFRIKNPQPPKPTRDATKWIINKNGSIKYLFPNPNTFDEFTDINELYEMADMGRLQPKGKNKIKIETPCEISETGYIEFRGKLRIL